LNAYSYPEAPEQPSCILLFVPVELVPIVGAQFAQLEQRHRWATTDDWQLGYAAFVDLEAQLMNNCLDSLIQEIRDFRGIKPDFVETELVDRTSDMYQSLNDIMASMLEMRGVLVDGWFTDQSATLADIVRAMRGSNQAVGASLWADIAALLGSGASLASIVGFVANLLTSQEEVVVEGGLMLAQIATTAAVAAILESMAISQATQSGALLAIIEALRGSTAPTDNILEALRGTVDASATRNLADLLS